MNGSIRERIVAAEDDLLTALSKGVDSVETSLASWELLSSDIQHAILTHTLDNETIEMAFTTTSRIGIISEGLLDFYDITSKLRNELDRSFARLSLSEISSPPLQNIPLPHSDIDSPYPMCPVIRHIESDIATTPAVPPYIATAYKWLLKNLHDPYPPNEIKKSISRDTGSSLRHVNAWFMNVRRRMGWTGISKKYFSGNRAATIDAAYRALVTEDTKRPLESDITLDFIKMKVVAEDLFSEKFEKSVLALKLDVAVKDSTEDDGVLHVTTRANIDQIRKENESVEPRVPDRATSLVGKSATVRPELSYPSPHRSPCTSPEPLAFDSPPGTSEEDSAPPRVISGRKRRISSSSVEYGDVCQDSYDRPNKRFRPISTEPAMTFPLSPKSPTATLVDISLDQKEESFNSSEIFRKSPSMSRKRCLSDADHHPVAKRPRGLNFRPRAQIASGPLPVSGAIRDTSQFEEWFRNNFELPDPVTTDDLDSLSPVDVDTCNGWTFLAGDSLELPHVNLPSSLDQQTGLSRLTLPGPQSIDMGSHAEPDPNAQFQSVASGLELDTVAPRNSTLVRPAKAIDAMTDNVTVVDNRLQCPLLSTACLSATSPIDNDLSHLFNVDDLLSLPKWSLISVPENQPVEPQSSACSPFPDIDCIGSADCSWVRFTPALPFDHNPNLPNSSQVFFDEIISQGSSDIDQLLSIPLIPSSILPIGHPSDAYQLIAEKHAKLEKLQKHREEVRKLEAELAL